MELLIFAHRGEAQEFIKRFSMRPIDHKNALYEGHDRLLLISGEGIYEVFTSLGPVIGSRAVTRAWNIGIAGALNQDHLPGDFVQARTVYCESEKVQFQSFTLDSLKSNEGKSASQAVDIITSTERVLSDAHADKLENFAPVVDRELWAIAKLCATRNIPLRSTKLISDRAGYKTECFDLKKRALEFSTALLEKYLSDTTDEAPISKGSEEIVYPLPMSFTQKARYRKNLDALTRFNDFDLSTVNEWARQVEENSGQNKVAANILLERMELALNPAKGRVEKRFRELSIPVTKAGANLHFDKNFEKKKFTLQMEINDQKNIDNLREGLASLRFSDFERVWDGKDV